MPAGPDDAAGRRQAVTGSAAALSQVLDAAPTAALLLQPEDQRVVAGNAEAATLLGCAAEDMPATWDTVLAGSCCLHSRLSEVRATTAAEVFDITLTLPGGLSCAVLVRARQVSLAGRTLLSVGLVSIARRRKAEAALATANRRLAVALAGADLGAWHWDAATGLLEVSPRWAAMVGRPPPTGGIPLDAWEALLHPDDVAPTRALLAPMVRGTSDRYETEFRLRHAAGHWVWIRTRGEVLDRDAAGRALAITGTHLDLTDLRRAAAAQASSEREARHRLAGLELVYRTAPLGLAQMDQDLRFVRINQAMADMNGFPIEAHLGRNAWDLVPDLRAAAEPLLRRVLAEGEAITGIEFTGETPREPGVKRDWVEHFYPVRDPETDDVLGVGLVCEEVTERKRAERARELLLRELDHRVKNLFAIISSLVSFTARAAVDTAAMRDTLLGRIQALAQAHDLVRPALGGPQSTQVEPLASGGTSLDALVLALLHPFQADAGEAERLVLQGPAVRLGPIAAPPLALALHELATNAAKYGALAQPGGAVAVRWSEAADDMLQLVWREEGGPPVDTPRHAGFGHRLVTQSAAQLGGRTRFEWISEGLRVELLLPRGRLQH